MTPGAVSASPDEVRRALVRRLVPFVESSRVNAAADSVMVIVSPVLEARDARIAELEALAEELIGEYRPYPREGDSWFRPPSPVHADQMARWRAALDGEKQ